MTYVKICGIRSSADALAARDAGADFIGVVFAASRRRVTAQAACEIVESLGADSGPLEPVSRATGSVECLEGLLAARRPLVVGVFEGQTAEEIETIARRARLDVLQLHGRAAFMGKLTSRWPVIRAVEPGAEEEAPPDAICLIDGSRGRGRLVDWRALATAATKRPMIVAGGLTPENVARIVCDVRPWGVDVSSGIETNGQQDAARVRRFIAAAKSV